MSDNLNFSFRIVDGQDYKSRCLIYEELNYRLLVYLEMAGGKEYDWTGSDTSFKEWTNPKGVLIEKSKKDEIVARLYKWAKEQKIRIDIGPPVDVRKMIENYKEKGYIVESNPDGSTKVLPLKRNMRNKIFGWLVIVWGGLILLSGIAKLLFGGTIRGMYDVGQFAGFIFGGALFFIGIYTLNKKSQK